MKEFTFRLPEGENTGGQNSSLRLSADRITAGYESLPVVTGLEFAVHAGEVLALIGPNGAGKSTVLKSIAGQLALLGGTVYLEEKELGSWTSLEKAKKMAVLLTGHPSAEQLTVRDVVSTGRYPYTGMLGILSESDRNAVETALVRVGAQAFAEKQFSDLSDGQKQRVLLARALCQEPEILVLDEPSSFLDIRHKLELVGILRSLAGDQGLAVVLSMHELEIARVCADRIICLKDGKPDRTGTPEEIFEGDYIARLYGVEDAGMRALLAETYGFTEGDGKNQPGKTGKNQPGKTEKKRPGGTGIILPGGTETSYGDFSGSGRELRCGYTTGTCAALASAGAAARLLTGIWPRQVSLITPKGWRVETPLLNCRFSEGKASCAVRKDAGDDPDCTDGMLIYAGVSLEEESADMVSVKIEGGEGIGRVTLPGLDQPVGEAAINSVPRKMIREAVENVCRAADVRGRFRVVISAPGGEETAAKTFNPRMGILGGISILGTSGIVEPMSRKALTETIALELRQCAAGGGENVILTPGNYGLRFLKQNGAEQSGVSVVTCSNFIGEALDAAARERIHGILLVGHAGKLIKTAGGIMNTHSREADCRQEIFAAHAACCGASQAVCRELMGCVTADACIEVLRRADLEQPVMQSIMKAIQTRLSVRAGDSCRIGAVVFSDRYGVLGVTEEAEQLLEEWKWYISSEPDAEHRT